MIRSLIMVLALALVIVFNSIAFANPYLPEGVPSAENRIHSNYAQNTDACAACHFTHTAPGARLLQWGSIYETCAACHDGSLGDYTYDVFSGYVGLKETDDGARVRTFGGLFGDLSDEEREGENSLSIHSVSGYVALEAAPGAKFEANEQHFDCASCHTPHGQGGNARILSPDPGKMKINDFFANEVSYPKTVVDTENFDYVEYLGSAADNAVLVDSDNTHWLKGYPYNKLTGIFLVPNALNPTFKIDPSNNTKDGVYAAENTVIKLKAETDYTINWGEGKVTLDDNLALNTSSARGSNILSNYSVYAVRVPGIFIAMKIDNYMQEDETVSYLTTETAGKSNKWTEGINAYCGACHGLYNTQGTTVPAYQQYDFFVAGEENHGSGSIGYEGLYRHQVGFIWNEQWTGKAKYVKFAYPLDEENHLGTTKTFTCLGCHFAHGTDEAFFGDYIGSVLAGDPQSTIVRGAVYTDFSTDLHEQYGSSALKRLPNMGICEDCHDKAGGNDESGRIYSSTAP